MQPAIFMPARIFLHLYQRDVFVRKLVLQNRVFVYVCMHDYQLLCVCMYVCVCVCVAVDCECEGQKSRKAAFVTFIDYGSVDSIPVEQLSPLDQVCAIILYGYLSSLCFETSTT